MYVVTADKGLIKKQFLNVHKQFGEEQQDKGAEKECTRSENLREIQKHTAHMRAKETLFPRTAAERGNS